MPNKFYLFWIAGVVIVSLSYLLTEKVHLTETQTKYGFFVLLFFGASIILSTWLLSAVPSAQIRLNNSGTPDAQNDIYRMKIFSFIPFTIGRFSGIVHTYFLIGVIFFALFIFSLF